MGSTARESPGFQRTRSALSLISSIARATIGHWNTIGSYPTTLKRRGRGAIGQALQFTMNHMSHRAIVTFLLTKFHSYPLAISLQMRVPAP